MQHFISICALGLSTLILSVVGLTSSPDLCKTKIPGSYEKAMRDHAQVKKAIEEVGNQPIAVWYTDRDPSSAQTATKAFEGCSAVARPVIVIYGLPNKDCVGGHSRDGSNKNDADYKNWIESLSRIAGDKPVIYILEPDAIGLLDQDCAKQSNYANNIRVALEILGRNSKADIYLDVGYWRITSEQGAQSIASVVNSFVSATGRLKGVAINTSNYRTTSEMEEACRRFIRASGKDFHCVIDTSRNNRGPSGNEWCNPRDRGIGQLPAKGSGAIDYYLWIKPPGESDGNCNGGPGAGQFFYEGFKMLWNNGYYVDHGFPKIGDNGFDGPWPSSSIEEHYGYDCYGNDIDGRTNIDSSSLNDCINKCRGNQNCRGVAFNPYDNKCWLKTKLEDCKNVNYPRVIYKIRG